MSTALFIVGLGIVTTAFLQLYRVWQGREAVIVTTTRTAAVMNALDAYFLENGHYPCPASLTASIDSAEYGREQRSATDFNACSGSFKTGTASSTRGVWVGAVPVRTLNLPDEATNDGWRDRFVYALSEGFAALSLPVNENLGAVAIQDASGNNATAVAANIAYAVISPGPEQMGAYSDLGALVKPCVPSTPEGRNCAYQTSTTNGGTFTNTAFHAAGANTVRFEQHVEYRAVANCNASSSADVVPLKVAYLVDTSGSMGEAGGCPQSLGKACSRIDVARWALRRVVPARLAVDQAMAQTNETNGSGDDATVNATMMTGFVANRDVATPTLPESEVTKNLTNIEVSAKTDLDSQINALCPHQSTPLGVHIQALADKIGNGTKARPNKIMVISDGLNNVGIDPVVAAQQVHQEYPDLKIDIIDVTGNPSLQQISTITGGTYALSVDGDKMLDTMMAMTGLCGAVLPPIKPRVDTKSCGSSGNWWVKK